MQSSGFKFHRLPNTRELNSLNPNTAYYGHIAEDNPIHGFPTTLEDDNVPVSSRTQLPRRPDQGVSTSAYHIIGFIGHLVLTFSPVIFLVLAFAALSVNGKPLSHKGSVVIQASKLGPSLFPIVFAAVVGRLMRTFALWRAERGDTIGLLEQLNGSQNLLAAVERAFHLRGLKGWSVLIILLWALSPIGGQSSLRVLDVGKAPNSSTILLSYFDTNDSSDTAFTGASYLAYYWPTVSAIFQACILAPNKISLSSTDLWGNVKIPLMQTLPSYTGSPSQGWITIPQENKTTFSSLSGVPISGLQDAKTTNLTLESTYFNLTCPDSRVFTSSSNSTFLEFMDWSGPLVIHNNESNGLFYDASRGWSSFMVDTSWNATISGLNTTMNLIYASQNISGTYEATAYKCIVGYTYVESWVNCDGLSCYVEKMRPSRNNSIPSYITPWNSHSPVPLWNFLSYFPFGAGAQHDAVTSPMDYYIAGSNDPFGSTLDFGGSSGAGSSVYTNVTGEQIAQRLGILINTLWQAGNARTGMTNTGQEMPRLNITSQSVLQNAVYVADMSWIWLTICISFILLGCGIAGFAFKYMTKVPDMLGYVSTLAKDNPYFRENVGDDRLDGMDRARLLRDVMVQITDVKPGEERGHIALKSISVGEDRVRNRLGRRRVGEYI